MMDGGNIPDNELLIISFIGLHRSGKTASIESLIGYLKTKGYRTGTVKLMQHGDIPVDEVGKDTWRHRKAGAEFVIALTHNYTYLLSDCPDFQSMSGLLSIVPLSCQILILEGKPDSPDEHIPVNEVVCLKDLADIDETLKVRDVKEPFAFAGIFSEGFKEKYEREDRVLLWDPTEKKILTDRFVEQPNRIKNKREGIKSNVREVPILNLLHQDDVIYLAHILLATGKRYTRVIRNERK